MQACVLAAPLLNQLPANGMTKAAEDGPSACAPATHVGDLEEAPGSGFGLAQPQVQPSEE